MGVPLYQVDAFTDRPFAGNPAAVCLLDSRRDERWMQHVAREMNLSETAFLFPRGDGVSARGDTGFAHGDTKFAHGDTGPAHSDAAATRDAGFDLRWFTPTVEVDLCGHATLASAHVLWETGRLAPDASARFHTKSGLLACARKGFWIEMDFPANPPTEAPPPSGLVEALGAKPRYAGRSRFDWLVEVGSEEEVRALAPDFASLRKIDARGVIVTARAKKSHDFVSRFFAPAAGVDEDPVTGSAHCTLGPYWARMLGRDELVGWQASARGGEVRVKVAGKRVLLSGQAVTVMRGELL